MITASMKELFLLISIGSMITLGLGTQAEDNSDKYASGEESDEEAGPAPEDEGEGESKTKDKDRSNAEQQPSDGTLALDASSQGSEVSASSAGVYGDFNNDLFDDLAIGVISEDVGAIVNAGAVNVLYGGASGQQTSAPADQFWNQDSPGVNGVAEDFDIFGSALG